MRPLPLLAATLLVVFTTAARAAPLFLDILPPGQDGLVPASTVTAGVHATDQLAMYRDLTRAAPGLGESDLARFFKDASIGAPALPQRVKTPRPARLDADRRPSPRPGRRRALRRFGRGGAHGRMVPPARARRLRPA